MGPFVLGASGEIDADRLGAILTPAGRLVRSQRLLLDISPTNQLIAAASCPIEFPVFVHKPVIYSDFASQQGTEFS